MSTKPLLVFDRQVSTNLESALRPRGVLRQLVDFALADPRMDVQLRRRNSVSWVSFYCGLTSILDVVERGGQLRFKAHSTHRLAGTFVDEWLSTIPITAAASRVSDVSAYLTRMLGPGKVNPRYTATEGAVQTSISRFVSDDFGVFQREAVASFPSVAIRDEIVEPFQSRIWSAIKTAKDQQPWWPGLRDHGKQASPGLETDLLGIDSASRLLVIEVKPSAR